MKGGLGLFQGVDLDFSAGSLARLFRASGFEVLDVSYEYDDQYLLIEARPSTTTPAPGAVNGTSGFRLSW